MLQLRKMCKNIIFRKTRVLFDLNKVIGESKYHYLSEQVSVRVHIGERWSSYQKSMRGVVPIIQFIKLKEAAILFFSPLILYKVEG